MATRRKYRGSRARKGSRCKRMKRVRSKFGGTVQRCAEYTRGRGRRRTTKRRRRYRGKAPFNKGRKCVEMGTAVRKDGTVIPVCRSYGSKSGWRLKRRRKGRRVSNGNGGGIPIVSLSPAMRGGSVGSHYRASQAAARRYGEGQRTWLQKLLGTG